MRHKVANLSAQRGIALISKLAIGRISSYILLLAAHLLVIGVEGQLACAGSLQYWHSGQTMSWTEAFTYCSSLGGSLPVIQSACQNEIMTEVSGGTTWTWTAGTRLTQYSSSSNQFQWVTSLSAGSSPVFFNGITAGAGSRTSLYCNFQSGQPDNDGDQECVQTNYGAPGHWDDMHCSSSLQVVCMFPPCPGGTYGTTGSPSCNKCPGGTFNSQTGQMSRSSCLLCPTGYYAPAGSLFASPCPGGTFNPLVGQIDALACVSCPPGFYSALGSSSCVRCPLGTNGTTIGNGSCITCPSGSFGREGKAPCSPCPRGMYSNQRATLCKPCPDRLTSLASCDTNVLWKSGLMMSWTEAFAFCSSLGGSLPVIQSACQNEIMTKVSGGASWTWTAGTRLAPYSSSSNQFQWVTNLSAASGPVFFNGITAGVGSCTSLYCNFQSGQPNNDGDEECVRTNFEAPGYWGDKSCSDSFQVVCMFPLCAGGPFSDSKSIAETLSASSSQVFTTSETWTGESSASLSTTPTRTNSSTKDTPTSSAAVTKSLQAWSSSISRSMSPSTSSSATSSRTERVSRLTLTSSMSTSNGSISLSSFNISGSMSRTFARSASISTTVSAGTVTSTSSHTKYSELNSPALIVSQSTQTTMQAAMLGSVVASVASGPGSATDLQAMVLVLLARCSVTGTAKAQTNGGYKLVTPFALSDTARGALGGNAVVFGALLLCMAGTVAALRVGKGLCMKDACVIARFPGFLLLVSATLHQSTLFCAVRLCGGENDGVVDSLMGITAIVVCVTVPMLSLVAAAKVPRRFVQYEIEPGSRFGIAPLCFFVPVGVTLPRETRLMASSLITTYVYPSLLCVGVPFMSSFITNIVAVLPSSVPGWLCAGSMFASALVHLCIAVAIVMSRMFRFPSSSVLGVLGLLLTAALHAQIASGWRDGVDQMIAVQAGLSMVRSLVACFITWLEGEMMEDLEAVRTSRVIWMIGDGGLYLDKNSGTVADGASNHTAMMNKDSEMIQLPPTSDDDIDEADDATKPPCGQEGEELLSGASEEDESDLDAFGGLTAGNVDIFARFVEEASEHRRRLQAKGEKIPIREDFL